LILENRLKLAHFLDAYYATHREGGEGKYLFDKKRKKEEKEKKTSNKLPLTF